MTRIIFIRHGQTEWNRLKRIQGHTDIPLSAQGESQVLDWQLPTAYSRATWFTSPLLRARQTASLLTQQSVTTESALKEMSWGDWEGQTLCELRNNLGAEMMTNERRGMDFQPPNGESPRMVASRLTRWLEHLSVNTESIVCITHKGVIRAALSVASGWDMKSDFSEKIDNDCAQIFILQDDKRLRVEQLNFLLTQS